MLVCLLQFAHARALAAIGERAEWLRQQCIVPHPMTVQPAATQSPYGIAGEGAGSAIAA
jgi:hypothetical protein